MVQEAPTSTLSFSSTEPKCSIFSHEFSAFAKPKPSEPITEFAWIIFFLPIFIEW